jgi:hypothetical protein
MVLKPRGVGVRRQVLALAVLSAGPCLADDRSIPVGRWTVAQREMGWPCRLDALEIREAGRNGDISLTAFDRDPEGASRTWGTARVDRRVPGPDPARWFSATWNASSSSVLLQFRAEGPGRIVAIVRERPADRATSDRVRQVVLVPAAETRPVADAVTIAGSGLLRFDPSTTSPRVEPAGLFLADADGTKIRVVVVPDGFVRASSPCWSPDGRWLAFAGFDATGRDPLIRVAPASGGTSVAVAAGTAPTWSHDGTRIAFVASGKADFATDWSTPGRNDERVESVTLTGPRAGEVEPIARGIWPKWSPVDDRIAFVARRESNWDVYVRSSDGLAVDRLTDDPALDTEPTWAADGQSLVFLSDRLNRWDLYRVAVGTRPTPAERLTNHARREANPSLSPDGRKVAFIDARGRIDESILILDLIRQTARTFPLQTGGDRDPAWSPDGKTIAFVSRRPGPNGPGGR